MGRIIENLTIKRPSINYGFVNSANGVVIRNLIISDEVKSIDSRYLNDRVTIKNYIVDPKNKYYTCVDGVLFTKDMKHLVAYPRRHNKLFTYEVPQGVEVIEDEAFAYQYYLTKISFPDSLKVISRTAFLFCKRLEEVTIPASVLEIDSLAFRLMPKLKKVLVDSSNPYFFDDGGVVYSRNPQKLVCYPNGKRDKTYKIIEGTKEILPHVFYQQNFIKEIEMPDSLSIVGARAFMYAEELTTIKFSPNIIELGEFAFSGCSKLSEINWQDSFTQQEELEGIFCSCEGLSVVNNFPDEMCARMFYSHKHLREHGMKPHVSQSLFWGSPFAKEIAKRQAKYRNKDV